MLIITNNTKVAEAFAEDHNFEICYSEKDYLGILEQARNLVHLNYEILTHPLYGSVKPYETNFRTLVLTKSTELHYDSLVLIEDAITVAKSFYKDKRNRNWPAEIIDDFKVIDFDIISNTIARIIS